MPEGNGRGRTEATLSGQDQMKETDKIMLAYLDCFSGISGDMTLGAMVDLGVPVQWLQQEVGKLPLEGFEIDSRNVTRHGIRAVQVDVRVQENQAHRNFANIREMIDDSPFSPQVKANGIAVFDRLAAAEAAVHGIPKEQVHFHEVGGMDAIVDIMGTCLAMEYLHIDAVICSSLPLGGGFVQCRHGTLPVPAPATLEVLKGLPVSGGPVQEELVTPTGAAIAATLAGAFEPVPEMRIDRIGYGAGSRKLESRPNLLRIIVGEQVKSGISITGEPLVLLECCIDDMNPEFFGYLMERLFEDGALDVWWVPVYMKKNRPGTMIQVLCGPDKSATTVQRLFSETTTLGVRYHQVRRSSLAREMIEIQTPWGPAAAKQVTGIDGSLRVVPEFEACKRIAREQNIPLRRVYERILPTTKDA